MGLLRYYWRSGYLPAALVAVVRAECLTSISRCRGDGPPVLDMGHAATPESRIGVNVQHEHCCLPQLWLLACLWLQLRRRCAALPSTCTTTTLVPRHNPCTACLPCTSYSASEVYITQLAAADGSTESSEQHVAAAGGTALSSTSAASGSAVAVLSADGQQLCTFTLGEQGQGELANVHTLLQLRQPLLLYGSCVGVWLCSALQSGSCKSTAGVVDSTVQPCRLAGNRRVGMAACIAVQIRRLQVCCCWRRFGICIATIWARTTCVRFRLHNGMLNTRVLLMLLTHELAR